MEAHPSHPRFSKAYTASLILLLGSILTACSTTPQLLDAEDPSILQRPFTADQIRTEWKPGLEVLLHQWNEMQGESTDRMYVVDANADGATIEVTTTLADGTQLGDVMKLQTTWKQLRDHATYSISNATRSEVTIDTKLGRHECIQYHVVADGATKDLYFARDLPGPPILTETREGGELVSTVEQISRTKLGG